MIRIAAIVVLAALVTFPAAGANWRECHRAPTGECLFDELLIIVRQLDAAPGKPFQVESLSYFLAVNGRYELALELASELDDSDRRQEAVADVASLMSQAGDYDGALELARTIKGSHYRVDVQRSIVSDLATEGRFDDALELAQKIDNDPSRWEN